MLFIFKLQSISQAERRRFEPGLPLQTIFFSVVCSHRSCDVLVPDHKALFRLSLDHERTLEDGLLFDDAEPFEKLINQCRALETRANRPA